MAAAGINPLIWQLVLQALQTLIQGCGPAPAKQFVTDHPKRARIRMFAEGLTMTGSWRDAGAIADGAVKLGTEATADEYSQLAAADLPASFDALNQ